MAQHWGISIACAMVVNGDMPQVGSAPNMHGTIVVVMQHLY